MQPMGRVRRARSARRMRLGGGGGGGEGAALRDKISQGRIIL